MWIECGCCKVKSHIRVLERDKNGKPTKYARFTVKFLNKHVIPITPREHLVKHRLNGNDQYGKPRVL